MQIRKTFLFLLIVALSFGTVFAQTIPTGKLTGHRDRQRERAPCPAST